MASEPSTCTLEGKAVCVTGGGGHLGRALATGLARAGATVLICGRSRGPLDEVVRSAAVEDGPGTVVAEVADMGDDDGVERCVGRLVERCGRVDGWVNNAFDGAETAASPSRRSELEATVGSGLVDVIRATEIVARSMAAGGGGSIVNVASMYGMVSPQPEMYRALPDHHNPPGYGAAKAGVIQYSRYAACHLGPEGVRVNSVSPGPFPDPSLPRPFLDDLTARVPLGRFGSPGELVGPVRFLLSGESSFVTGHNLVVDGGWTSW